MKLLDTVKFSKPQTPDEKIERFIVLEFLGERVLVENVKPLSVGGTLHSQHVYLLADMEIA